MRNGILTILLGFALGVGWRAEAQTVPLPTQPFEDWRTIETRNFVVHYPHAMAEWTLPLVQRLEAVRTGVSELVGNAPREPITVLVLDPYNLPNGAAIPFLDAPTMILWPTPPGPRSAIGHNPGWADLLAVHEYGHIAHLTFPSRNPRERTLWRLLPAPVGPVARRAPRWVSEGYATYLEGKLTGSGRPYGAFRAAVLRQWALEGKLPAYEQLGRSTGFFGGAMAYLAGSAFLEWLVEQRGEESLNHLWRRLSARQRRSFGEAFTGVYGAPPDELYGQFTVEATRRALAAEEILGKAGIVDGETFQRRDGATGDPAVSPEGSKLAVVTAAPDRPPRLVIWSTGDEPADPRAARERERLLERDPQDVLAVDPQPLARTPLAVLEPVDGRAHENPRFLPEGRWVLVTRSEPLGDGTYRPDLFLWDWAADELTRITHGAGIREADPSPAGRRAVGVRCLNGICDLVRIDLETGAVETIHPGYPNLVFSRPRYSPNAREIVVSVQQNGRWRLALTDEHGAPLRFVDPGDGARRYDASFLPGGTRLVAVSEAGGIPNLEILDLASGTIRPLTRVTSLAVAPDAEGTDDWIYFLRLHSAGMDVHRIHPDSVRVGPVVVLEPQLSPPPPPFDTLSSAPPGPVAPRPQPYGFGPDNFRLLPGGMFTPQGSAATAVLARSDPVGRLSWTVQGTYGSDPVWSGVGASIAVRRFRPVFEADLFAARQRPSAEAVGEAPLDSLDANYYGALISASLARDWGFQSHAYRVGASIGRVDRAALPRDVAFGRRFAFAEYRGSFRQEWDRRYFAQELGVHAAMGRSDDQAWNRLRAGLGLSGGIGQLGVHGEFAYSQVPEDAPRYERMLAGGVEPSLFDASVLSQRRSMPALPFGVLEGDQLATARAALLVGPFRPYIWAASTDEVFRDWFRVVGAEYEAEYRATPLVRLPHLRFVAGIGYTLDEPFENKLRGYLTLAYRP